MREVSGARVETRSQARDLTRWPGCPAGLSRKPSICWRNLFLALKQNLTKATPNYFHVVIAGPQGFPFEGGTFKLELFLPEEYPLAAPKVCFVTKIYHPNVDKLEEYV